MFYRLNQKKLANALRILSIDLIHAANSGHPGMPMGMADLAEVLWNDFLVYNPQKPDWINRDRFVLSNGHGSALLYALLHLSGSNLTIDDLKKFRKLHSVTPGHPEYGFPGVEATTGPLGQGLGMAVGMAIAELLLSRQFNTDQYKIIDHYIYCFVGDGCLMEGVSHEVCSLAGTIGLNKLIVFWDNNQVSIDGNTKNWFTENVAQRFRSYNWNVLENIDGHDPTAIYNAIKQARASLDRPTLLMCNTIIGYGSSFAGTAKAHGSIFSADELKQIRNNLGWSEPEFQIPDHIYQEWGKAAERGMALYNTWEQNFHRSKAQDPVLYNELCRRIKGELPENLIEEVDQLIEQYLGFIQPMATRMCSKMFLEHMALKLPELFGGSADLASSDGTLTKNSIEFSVDQQKVFNYLHFGVREFGMFCILNGISLYKGFIPYGGTFLVFIDYARSALRLSAMMRQRVIYVLTHDSIGVGQDGPTHQPVEHLAMLRATPNLSVWRPCDLIETWVAWKNCLEHHGTSCLILSRQNLPQQQHVNNLINIAKGGYILYDPVDPVGILIATGSEVALAVEAAIGLANKFAIRVVSLPNVGLFLQQSLVEQAKVLPTKIIARVVVEAGSTLGWERFAGTYGKILGVNSFGLSAPAEDLYNEFKLNIATIQNTMLELLEELAK